MARKYLSNFIRVSLEMSVLLFTITIAEDNLNPPELNFMKCLPEIEFLHKGISQSLCLTNLYPQGDSCAKLQIFFKHFGIKFTFFCDKNHYWESEGIGYTNYQSQKIPINISIITGDDDKFSRAVIVLGKSNDTSGLWIDPYTNRDIPVIPDSTMPLKYDLNLSRFKCLEKPQLIVETDRDFTYPVSYRRTEPTLNYPELSVFHLGNSIKIPPTTSILKRGYEIVECHILHPPKMKYNDPEQIRKREIYNTKWALKHPPKKKKKKGNPPLLRFKPL